MRIADLVGHRRLASPRKAARRLFLERLEFRLMLTAVDEHEPKIGSLSVPVNAGVVGPALEADAPLGVPSAQNGGNVGSGRGAAGRLVAGPYDGRFHILEEGEGFAEGEGSGSSSGGGSGGGSGSGSGSPPDTSHPIWGIRPIDADASEPTTNASTPGEPQIGTFEVYIVDDPPETATVYAFIWNSDLSTARLLNVAGQVQDYYGPMATTMKGI